MQFSHSSVGLRQPWSWCEWQRLCKNQDTIGFSRVEFQLLH